MAAMNKLSGFTLVEMLMTVAVAAILLVIGIPSFRYVTNSNRIAAEINGLLGDMQFARLRSGQRGDTGHGLRIHELDGCDGVNVNTWQNGWIVFSDPTATPP